MKSSATTGFRMQITKVIYLQPFAKRLAVADLGNYENKQLTTDPKLGFAPPRAQSSTMILPMDPHKTQKVL
jgi:hypothetical protein